jgi:hypothetical protein
MKVTFDSNVWRIISTPETFPKEASIEDFKCIRSAIEAGQISPFICETVFTLEAILKKKRKEFFSRYKPVSQSSTKETNGEIQSSFTIGPDKTAHPGNNAYLKNHLKDAISIGFQIIKLPRIGGLVNPDIEDHYYKHKDLKTYLDKVFEVGRDIETKEAGFCQIKELGERYGTPWFKGLQNAPSSEDGVIAKAVAEWADGDSVACHIALGGDYFCTRDAAQKAGDKSVFNSANIQWLKTKYGLSIVSPEDLAQILRNK